MEIKMIKNYKKYKVDKTIKVDALCSIHYFEFNDTFEDVIETHEAWEMVYIDRGECEIIADDSCFVLKQGEIYFHKPRQRHMLRVIKGICPNVFIITFESSSPSMGYFEDRKLTADIATKQYISAIIHEASGTFDLPFNDPCALTLNMKEKNALWAGDQSILIRLELMLIELARRESEALKPQTNHYYTKDVITDEFCLKVIEYLETKIYDKINMEDMSHALSFSKSYIYKRFVTACGYSVVDYFTIMKINEAKRLIRETKKNFFEISEMLNFSSSHYFSTVFKRYVGMTPSQYKNSCKDNYSDESPMESFINSIDEKENGKMENIVRFAIIGTAGIGTHHTAGINKVDEAVLTAVCDIVEPAAKRAAAENGLDKYYTDYKEMLKDGGFDCVIICTPDACHAEQAIASLEAGYHVLCEKPLSMTMEECQQIVDAAKKSDKKFMVGQVCRYAPGFALAKELVDAGEIGELSFVESEYAHDYSLIPGAAWRRDPDYLRHGIVGGGCHAMDLLRWIAGNPVEVTAYSNRKVLPEWPVDDCYIAIMKYPNDVIGKVMCSIGCKRPYTMRTQLFGTKGTILCDNTSKELTLFKAQVDPQTKRVKYVPQQIPVSIDSHNMASEIKDMCAAILGDLTVATDAVEGANTVAVCLAAVKSSAEGRPVAPEYFG
ncbi:MAG: Gfo/Idh/MocA family oxidoreductase [Clostridia bacterium]|nr:Gfo/Idh/MocA family oxidoreductase [Clostridia bacterium]